MRILIGFFGTPLAALVLLVGIKTALDLFFHLREHRFVAPGTVPLRAKRPPGSQ